MSQPLQLPRWIDIGLLPLWNLAIALLVAGLVVMVIGHSPWQALTVLLNGALGSVRGLGYSLYYATTFIFTGLAVAVAIHAGLFNIGGEGQAYVGGLGVTAVALSLGAILPWWLNLPLAIALSFAFGALWAFIPAYLQAKRGSHIVITTIMFNFIASALLVYLLVGVLKAPGMAPETVRFPEGARLPSAQDVLAVIGIPFSRTPLNVSFLVALLACWGVWLLMWRMRLGYEIRAFGHSEAAARYAGISPLKITMLTMLISGGLAGLMAVNSVMGEQERLIQDNVLGAGFVGIAVALMGRSHPVGVLAAAILFGALYQGGAELEFETSVPREMVVVIQALVILFTGALDGMVRGPLEKSFLRFRTKPKPGVAAE